MSREVTLKINGKEVKATEGMTILQAAKNNGIEIPTLCYNEQLKPYGACRICTVEITKGRRKRLVVACVYPVEEGLEVETENERVRKVRKMILELLLPLSNKGPIKDLAEKYGVTKSRFEAEPTDCILCGLCVRYCAEVKKANAICFVGRGTKKQIAFVPEIAPNICPTCRECYSLCPASRVIDLGESIYSLSIPISEKIKKS
ncbi:(2Fe-2S)-binding protein [Candidatus Bathyarchaeota archaeon]|nr:MAG: (2Fe-2S)-binding protein [Candidatus Bathyarchaeota archaeon]